jgi:hypothetical protein
MWGGQQRNGIQFDAAEKLFWNGHYLKIGFNDKLCYSIVSQFKI